MGVCLTPHFSLPSAASDANITDAPVPLGGDTVRKINMATAGVSQLVFEYLIALMIGLVVRTTYRRVTDGRTDKHVAVGKTSLCYRRHRLLRRSSMNK